MGEGAVLHAHGAGRDVVFGSPFGLASRRRRSSGDGWRGHTGAVAAKLGDVVCARLREDYSPHPFSPLSCFSA